MRTGEIVVGADGSPGGTSAVRWAAGAAERGGRPLHIVVAYHLEASGRWYGSLRSLRAAADERAGAIASAAVAEAQSVAPHAEVTVRLMLGDAAPVLIEAAQDAAMLVVGSRGRGGFTGLLLGSVGMHVATHGPGPVAVVRGRTENVFGPVVVGVDGSGSADAALGLAFEQAAQRHCPLHAVVAYTVPTPATPIGIPPLLYEPERVSVELRKELDRQVSTWCTKYPDVAVHGDVVEGNPGAVLVDQSRHAQLVVVGTRGHGGFTGLLLGSVGLHLMHHAGCPVLIARDR